MDEEAPADLIHAYLDGVRARSVVPLGAEELEALVRRERRCRLDGWVARCFLLASLLVFAASLAVLFADHRGRLKVPERIVGYAAVGQLLACLGLIAGGLGALRATRKLRQVRHDRRDGMKYQFQLGAAVVMVTRCGELLTEKLKDWRVRPVALAAAAPEGGPLSPIPAFQRKPWQVGAERRRLSDQERAEVMAHARAARAAWRRPTMILLTLWWLGGVYANFVNPPPHRRPEIAAAVVVVGLGLGIGHFRSLRLFAVGTALRADATEGWVVRFLAGERAGLEVLDASGIAWARGGVPASGRLATFIPREVLSPRSNTEPRIPS